MTEFSFFQVSRTADLDLFSGHKMEISSYQPVASSFTRKTVFFTVNKNLYIVEKHKYLP